MKLKPLLEFKSSFDIPLLLAVISLVLFGLIMVYDASAVQAINDHKDKYFYIKQQLIWVIIGFSSMFIFSFFDYRRFKGFSFWMLIGSFILLVAVLIPGLGVAGGGAHRWLNLGFITLQPAEIIKLTLVLYLAALFEKKVKIIPLLLLLTVIILITAVFQKDLGTTVVIVATSFILYFIAGGSFLHLAWIIPIGTIALTILVATSMYRVKRVLAFLDPFSDVQGFTYHISQILIALGSGGFFGLGFGQSRQKFEYIPEATTDSIFAIIGEELGFIGSLLLILLFALLIIRGFEIAKSCPDNFGRILALGLTCWLGIQTIINLSSMVALMPLTGVPLPFISYGGSALVVNLTAVGILLNISRN